MLDQALRWNGKQWTQTTTPQPGGTAGGDANELVGVDCIAGPRCWAVGTYGSTSETPLYNNALQGSGGNWTQSTTPNPGGNGGVSALFGVSCTSSANCWAVGTYGAQSSGLNEALHWNGVKWSQG